MARATLRRRLTWIDATVVSIHEETPRVRTIVFDCPGWDGHRPGQHVDVRLTAADGYQAQRSYSIAAPQDGSRVTLTVERLEDGEVSDFLVDDLRTGDVIELRGPIGGYFVWEPQMGGPLLLVSGGSGVVPLMAMLRARVQAGDVTPVRLLHSSRDWDEVIFGDEMEQLSHLEGIDVIHTVTRRPPFGWTGYTRRIDAAMLREVAPPPAARPLVYICGPTGLVESASRTLVLLGHDAARIRTERFGPTGDG
jgi:ferredoxin-NADP reductase